MKQSHNFDKHCTEALPEGAAVGPDGQPIEGAAPVVLGEDGQPIPSADASAAPEPEPEVTKISYTQIQLEICYLIWKCWHLLYYTY